MKTINQIIRDKLFSLRDEKYAAFICNLTPDVEADRFIGVRTPALRSLAKELQGREDIGTFLATLPHDYFEENQLHAFLLSGIKNYAVCMEKVEEFLPFVDNWATCDQLSPKVFRKNREKLLPHIDAWIRSEQTFQVRFGIKMLMDHFLNEAFDLRYPERVAVIRSEEYYVNMMIAWYFATALAKQYDACIPFLEEKRLAPWTHNKTIQKCVESYRILPEQKEYLKTLKIAAGRKG